MSGGRTFVLVGHCLPDWFMLKSALKRAVPGASIAKAGDDKSLRRHLGPDAVLLVNRELDGRFASGPSGIDLIRQVNGDDDPPVTMLISNLGDAQGEAVAAGARPGFGKSSLYDPATVALLQEVAEVST